MVLSPFILLYKPRIFYVRDFVFCLNQVCHRHFHSYRSSDENEEEDDDDVTPQQRYKLREKKPVTKRYTAPPLKECKSTNITSYL